MWGKLTTDFFYIKTTSKYFDQLGNSRNVDYEKGLLTEDPCRVVGAGFEVR